MTIKHCVHHKKPVPMHNLQYIMVRFLEAHHDRSQSLYKLVANLSHLLGIKHMFMHDSKRIGMLNKQIDLLVRMIKHTLTSMTTRDLLQEKLLNRIKEAFPPQSPTLGGLIGRMIAPKAVIATIEVKN